MISPELESSLNLAVSEAARRGHEYVTVEHVLLALLANESAMRALKASGASIDETRRQLEAFFKDHYPTPTLKAGQMPQPTLAFQRVIQRAAQHVRASGKEKIKGDNILVSIFSEKESFAVYFLKKQNVSRFDVINYMSHGIVKPGVEEGAGPLHETDEPKGLPGPSSSGEPEGDEPPHSHDDEDDDGEEGGRAQRPREGGKSDRDPLKLYCVDLCQRAKAGKIDPLIGRDAEIERTVQVLCRRRKNNPLYVGDAGVGKTAIAEGLALRIVEAKVPDPLKNAEIFALDMGTLIAGSRFRGDFEQRIKDVLKALNKKPHAVLFIDEIHTVIGAGAVSGGALDASNLLKPALSSGQLRCIGSTTYKEYRQHFKNDHALDRRFQKIDVDEPSVEDTVKILKGLKSRYEKHHDVTYTSDALRQAAELAARHLRERKLPDTAIDVIDEAGAAFALRPKKFREDGVPGKPLRVTAVDIQNVVAKMARIPPQKVSSTDRQSLKDLEPALKGVVFGQDQAIDSLCAAIKLARSGLRDEEKPIGSFLFAGPTGVGKTEVAKQLAKILGVEFIRIDMSEYMERHTVSRLIGAPPGYGGFDQGGLLTDAVAKTPHAVLLLDEIEKAHGEVQNILLQVMDHGTLTDSNGRKTDFRNVIIIMTTNAGARELTTGSIGFNRQVGTGAADSQAVKDLFSPEFRNRLDAIISFLPLGEEIILSIVDKFLGDVRSKLAKQKVHLEVTLAARKFLARKGFDPAFGARPLARQIQDKVKKPLADELLFGKLAGGGQVIVDHKDDASSLSFDLVPAKKPVPVG
jgi:ATP-dependent Clp protease ATP-binding subunit ClpA